MGARVGHQHSETVSEKELRVSGHTEAIVGESMEKNHCIVVAAVWMNGPCAERDRICRNNGNIFKVGTENLRHFPHA